MQALSITIILTIGMIGIVSGFNETNETKTTTEAIECDHKDAAKCEKHSAEKCKYEDGKATKISGSCYKTAKVKSCEMKSVIKCTKSIDGSNKTI